MNVAHSDRIIKGLRFVFVELPKFKPQSILEKKMAVLWLRFLTEVSEKSDEVPAELLENAETSKALGIIERSAMNEAQLYAYERFWDAVVNERVLINGGYKKGHEEGLAEGREEGRAEGHEEGRAEGLAEGHEKGRAEGLAEGEAIGMAKERERSKARQLETARCLKAAGLAVSLISQATGLPVEEIERLNP